MTLVRNYRLAGNKPCTAKGELLKNTFSRPNNIFSPLTFNAAWVTTLPNDAKAAMKPLRHHHTTISPNRQESKPGTCRTGGGATRNAGNGSRRFSLRLATWAVKMPRHKHVNSRALGQRCTRYHFRLGYRGTVKTGIRFSRFCMASKVLLRGSGPKESITCSLRKEDDIDHAIPKGKEHRT